MKKSGLLGGDQCTVVVAALPPPITGQSHVTNRLIIRLNAEVESAVGARLIVSDVSPRSLFRGPLYHVTRILKVLVSAVRLLWVALLHTYPTRVYLIYESGFGIVYNYFLIACARIAKCSIIVHHHTSEHTLRYELRAAKLFEFAGASATHVVLCGRMRENLAALYPCVGRILVSSNACHVNVAADRGKRRGEEFVLGILSNLSVSKGALVAFACAEKLLSTYPGVRFRIAGPVCDDETASGIVSLSERFPGRVESLGLVVAEEKNEFFSSIDVFLFPSIYRYEAQPLVVLEAMAAGIPFVSIDIGYIREISPGACYLFRDAVEFVERAPDLIGSWIRSEADYDAASYECAEHFLILKSRAEVQLTELADELI